jgi:hypothetical protein
VKGSILDVRYAGIPAPRGFLLGAFVVLVLWTVPLPGWAITVELSGQVTFRPQSANQPLSTTKKTILFADESLQATARVVVASAAERKAFPLLVLQQQHAVTKAWIDIHTFYRDITTGGKFAKPDVFKPDVPRRFPQDQAPKSPFPERVPAPISSSYNTPSFSLPVRTNALRASARRADGTSVESLPLLVEVRDPPAVLTLLAMGGSCHDPDANTNHTNLTEAMITRNADVCAKKGVQETYLKDLTPPAAVNCNDPCNANCMNFLEHLALRIMNERGLATQFDSIDNPGQQLCHPRQNLQGIRNHIIFGKWRNTEEEWVCSTPIKFNTIIDNFVKGGGKSLILIGQSLGGAKFAEMVRDHWRWGNNLTLELLVLWDATSVDILKVFPGKHPFLESMGVQQVGSRPRHTLSFYQYSNLAPFQNGAPLLDPCEQHDLDGCFSHNAIARSQFVHHKTTDAVHQALVALRNRARE